MVLKYARSSRSKRLPSHRSVGVAASGGFNSPSSYGLSTGTPDIRDPLFSPEGFYITNQDIKTYNKWIRYYDAFHPILPNSLDIHSLFPISDFSFKGIEDPFVSEFYTFVKDDVLNLLDWVILVSTEYERLGEAFSFFQWDSYQGYFKTATILNPDLLEVYPFEWGGAKRFIVSMDIPETFRVLYDKKSVDSRYREMWLSLDPVIRRCVESGLPIPLNPDNVFGMQRLQHAYDVRGTSQVLRVLKDLMHEDKLREAQMAVADGHITPYQLWKIGNSQQGYIPTDAELAEWDKLLARAEHQNLFRIVTHSDVTYETKGVSDGLLNITAEMEKIEDRILTALYTSRSMTTGEGPTYSNAVIGLKVLEGRYQNKLYRIASTIRSLFKKIAYANGFYEITPAELSHGVRRSHSDRRLLVPMVHWENYFSFSKDIERAKFYQTLAQAHKISWRRVLEILGLDFDEERKVLSEDMKTVMDSDIYKSKITDLTGDKGDPYAGGPPTDLSSPPSPGETAMEDVGAEVMEDVGAPPLPTIDI